MKNKVRGMILCVLAVVPSMHARFIIDEVKAVIYGVEGTEVILHSDTTRLSLEGAPKTFDDVVMERLMLGEAKRYKIIPDEDAIDHHLATVQRENNLTADQLKQIFTQSGYTYEEGRQQFATVSSINTLLDFKVRSRVVIKEKDVLEFYNNNPLYEEATYTLERAVIASPGKPANADDVQWGTPFVLKHSEVSEKLQFIFDMGVGALSEPRKVDVGYEVFRLKGKTPRRLVSFESRYSRIVGQLSGPKYQQLISEYKKYLFDNSVIVTF